MKTTTSVSFLFFLVCLVAFCVGTKLEKRTIFNSDKSNKVMDVSDFSIYYDLETNETIRKMMPRPWYKPGWLLRLPFTGGRCNCEGLKCTCCTGIRVETFNFDRKTCAVLTYEPEESMIGLEVKMNNETVFRNTYSARNPPTFCVPIAVPYLPPGLIDMCVRLFDVSVMEQKLHVCMDMDTRVDKAPVIVLHFDCMDMGFSGIGLSKPGGTAPNLVTDENASATTEPVQLDSDVFDPVTEKSTINTQTPFNNSNKYI